MCEDKFYCADNDFKEEKITDFVRRKIANEEKIYDLAELFKVFGDSTRTKRSLA